MKIRRLSEIDLARICPLSRDDKVFRLQQLKVGRPPHTYNPMRASLGDILNLQPELFLSGGEYTLWSQIAADIAKRCTSESEEKFNLSVARALYDYGRTHNAKSYRKIISPWSVGYGQSVTYWWNLYTVLNERPCFVFVDPRLSNPLTIAARRFVLSMMNERIRVLDLDFADSALIVAQFSKTDNGERMIRLFLDSEISLYTADELNEMINETYQLWVEILSERVDTQRRKSAGTTPMGF